jgi:hypothetical protein
VKALVEEAGWQLEPVSGRPGANNPPNSLLVGLVLADGFSKGH